MFHVVEGWSYIQNMLTAMFSGRKSGRKKTHVFVLKGSHLKVKQKVGLRLKSLRHELSVTEKCFFCINYLQLHFIR